MKRFILLVAMAVITATSVWAQSKNVKRPETFNFQRAMEAYGNENYDEAITYLQQELQQDEKNGYAYLYVASINNYREEYGKALAMINKALTYLPKKDKEYLAAAYDIRSNIFLATEDTLKALDDINMAVKIYPEDDEEIEKRGDLYWQMKKYDLSNIDYLYLISKEESNASGHMGYGRNLMYENKLSDAKEQFSYVIKMYNDYSRAYAFLAECQLREKKWNDAADNLIQALSIDGDNKAYNLMSDNTDKSFNNILLAKLKAELNKEPNSIKWQFLVARVYENQKQYVKAIELYKKVNDADPASSIAKQISDCYDNMGAVQKAIEYNDLAFSLDSTNTILIGYKAGLLYNNGDVYGAIDVMSQFIEKMPDLFGGYYRRGFFEDNACMVDEAIEDYTMAITLDSTYYYSYMGRADQYMKKGMTQEAMADYRRVTELDTIPSESPCAFYAFLALGEKEKAIAYLDSCIAKFPDDPGKEYDACCFYCRMGETDTALSHLRKALEMGYNEFAHMGLDDDIDIIRNMPEYKKLMDEYKAKHEEKIKALDTDDDGLPATQEETTEIPFTKDYGNTCTVKCSINDLPLNFVFDTGASSVSLSQVEATFMMKNGYLTKQDVIGKQYYSDANGNVNEGTVINLRNVNFGGIELKNIQASVVKNQKAPLLLGQSVFQKLGKIEIDNERQMLKVTRRTR